MKTKSLLKQIFSLILGILFVQTWVYGGVSGKPDIEITSLTDSPDPVSAGGDITYTVNIKNSSADVSAFNVYVDFSSSSSLSLTKISGSGWSCSSNHCTYASPLPAGTSATTLKVKRTAPNSGGTINLTAHADSDTTDGDTSNNVKTVTTTVEAPKEPKLKITKTANTTDMNVNDSVTFTLKAQNTGDATATGTKITDTVPSIFDITSYSSGCSKSGQKVTCTIGNLNAGASKTFRIYAKAKEPGDATNTAKITADNASSKTSSVSLHVRGVKLQANTVSAYSVASGEKTTFKYRVKNNGDATAQNTYLYIDLDDAFTITSNGGCTTLSGKKLKCGPYTLNAGSYSPTITVEARAPEVSSSRSYKTVFSAQTTSAGNPSDISSSRWKTIYAVNLSISKNVSPTEVGPGDDATFTIRVTNKTGATVSGVKMEDTLPSGFSISSLSPSECSKSGRKVTCNFSSLSNNAHKDITVHVKAPTSLGTYTNTAETTSTHATRSWSDDATLRVSGAHLSVDKRVSPSYVAPGGEVVYTIEVTNDGFDTAHNVLVDDSSFPAGFSVTKIEPAGCTLSSCNLGDIAVNQTKTMKIWADAASSAGNYTNTAVAEDNQHNRGQDSATVHVQNVDIQAILQCTDYVAISGNYVCYAYIRERNAPAVTNAELTFSLPSDVNRASFRGSKIDNIDSRFTCSVSGRDVHCQMKSGEQISQGYTRVVRVLIKAFDAAVFDTTGFNKNGIVHSLDVSTTLSDGNSGNNHDEETTWVRGANPSITKTGDSATGPGHEMTYTIRVRNWPRDNVNNQTRPSTTATHIEITDPLPLEVEFVSASGSNWTCPASIPGNLLTCTYASSIAPNHSADDLHITVRVKDDISLGSNIVNSIFVTNDTPELKANPDLTVDNEDSWTTTVEGAHLSTSVSSSLDSVIETNKVVFDFTVRNDGYAPAGEVNATFDFDRPDLIDSLSLLSAPSYCRIVDKSVECNTSELADGDEITAEVEATTANVDSDQVVTARVQADANNTDPSSAEKSVTIVDFATYAEWRMDDCHIKWKQRTVKEENGRFPGTTEKKVGKVLKGKVCSAIRVNKNNSGNNKIKTSLDINDLGSGGTIMFWFKSFVKWEKADNQKLFDCSTTHGHKYYYLYLHKGRLKFAFEDSADDDFTYETSNKLTYGAWSWHHIALTFDQHSHQIKIYVDGSLIAGSLNKSWTTDIADVGPLYIGGNSSTYAKKKSANGAFDEFKVFDSVLDAATIQDIYQNEDSGKNFNGSERVCPACGADARIKTFSASPNKIYAENPFDYTIKIQNIDVYPIEEVNLTVDIDNRADVLDINYTSDWSCSFDGTSSRLSCYFDADGNESAMFKPWKTKTITLKMRAPNEVITSSPLLSSEADIATSPVDDFPEDNRKTKNVKVYPVDISIAKTVDNDEPNQNEPYLYTLNIKNNSGMANHIKVVDEIESTLNITSIANDDANWTCNTIGHTIECQRDSLPAVYDGNIYIMVTPTVDKPIHNEANVSTTTAETRLGNNRSSVDVNVQSSVGTGWDKSKFKDFTLRKNRTFYGDLLVIGNSNLEGSGSSGDKLADINATYVSGNKSSANLNLESYEKVQFARLYWTGHLHGAKGDASDEGEDEGFKTITFYTPDGNTHTLTADDNDTYFYYYKDAGDTYRRIYSASVDVTDILNDVNQSRGTYGGTYAVGGIKANTGKDIFIRTPVLDSNGTIKPDNIKFGHFAGWNLVVFYEVDHRTHREQVYKNINIFDGFRKLLPASVGYEKLTIPVSGFITPKFGDIDSRLSLFAAGGERNVELDSISIVSKENNVSSEVKISDALNPENNVLNGTISRAGSDVSDRVPDQDYNIGIDLDQFDISSDFSINKIYFGHLQQDTNITLSVGRQKDGSYEIFDQSFPTAIGISTQIYNPDFIDSYKECFVEDKLTGAYKSCSDVNISRGGEIIYRITIVNTGDEKASNVIIEDPLPKEVDFNISTADLKVVTNTKPLCAGLDTSAESINDCAHHLETLGVFDHRVLTDEGKTYISSYFGTDVNETNNRLYDDVWNASFSDYNVTTEGSGEEEHTKLTIDLSNELNQGEGDEYEGYFPALNVTWIEFKVKVNTRAVLNKTFENIAYINFTNPTLAAYGYPDATQRQESASVESPPVVFQWTQLQGDIRDPGRISMGTKIVNHPFDLNISIDDSNSTFATFAANYPDVNLTVAAIALVDNNLIPQGGTCDSYMSMATLAGFDRDPSTTTPDFGIVSNEYIPIGSGMYWVTDRNITSAIAAKDVGFCLLFRMSYKDGTVTKYADAPAFYGPFGDHFALRPQRIDFDTGLPKSGDYYVVKAGQTFALDANATDGMTALGTPGYTTVLSAGELEDGNTSLATISIFDEKGCIDYKLSDPTGVKVHLYDFNFTNGDMAAIPNNKFDDVGIVTIRVRDVNWSEVDVANDDCNSSSDDDQNGSFVSCAVKGEAKFIFVPDKIEVQTTVNNQGNGFTYMANDLDAMHTNIHAKLRSLNLEGNVTEAFKSGCYADDVNLSIDANFTFASAETVPYVLNWKVDGETTINTLSIAAGGVASIDYVVGESNFSNGEADIDFLVNVARTKTHAYYPLDMDTLNGRTSIDNYLGRVDVPESTSPLDADNIARFWYARLHAPDYRSSTTTIETPIYIEVFCNDDKADCSQFGMAGLPESSDDVFWWVNTNHSGAHLGVLFDMNATQKNQLDPLIKINGGTNVANDINASFAQGVYVPTVTYTGSSKLYRTQINTRPSEWLKYNRFYADGRTKYHVEFNLPVDEWSGIGQRGETVETNGSRKSNRRLEW
ncbi:LamG-like jellyroll fold domain-containing protein [Hydrogenimonas urashimensis]|uniref:LamG-like jellyroll fold domain-containing protein n=1 Tax=Hydrogenimonas urashimensis TaxID=2740515 RepID=UPI0019161468|nr:LamG domain-containing protein [Hydrogenimonas urashimensis]